MVPSSQSTPSDNYDLIDLPMPPAALPEAFAVPVPLNIDVWAECAARRLAAFPEVEPELHYDYGAKYTNEPDASEDELELENSGAACMSGDDSVDNAFKNLLGKSNQSCYQEQKQAGEESEEMKAKDIEIKLLKLDIETAGLKLERLEGQKNNLQEKLAELYEQAYQTELRHEKKKQKYRTKLAVQKSILNEEIACKDEQIVQLRELLAEKNRENEAKFTELKCIHDDEISRMQQLMVDKEYRISAGNEVSELKNLLEAKNEEFQVLKVNIENERIILTSALDKLKKEEADVKNEENEEVEFMWEMVSISTLAVILFLIIGIIGSIFKKEKVIVHIFIGSLLLLGFLFVKFVEHYGGESVKSNRKSNVDAFIDVVTTSISDIDRHTHLKSRTVLFKMDNGPVGLILDGAFTRSVKPNGQADRAGVQPGDQIISINDISIEHDSHAEILRTIMMCGEEMKLVVRYNPERARDTNK